MPRDYEISVRERAIISGILSGIRNEKRYRANDMKNTLKAKRKEPILRDLRYLENYHYHPAWEITLRDSALGGPLVMEMNCEYFRIINHEGIEGKTREYIEEGILTQQEANQLRNIGILLESVNN
ncbi:MAG: hypothetical protein AABW79_01670 [Nanoarchaeota archaeon]